MTAVVRGADVGVCELCNSGLQVPGGHLDIGISGVWCPVSGFQYFGETEVFFLYSGQATK